MLLEKPLFFIIISFATVVWSSTSFILSFVLNMFSQRIAVLTFSFPKSNFFQKNNFCECSNPAYETAIFFMLFFCLISGLPRHQHPFLATCNVCWFQWRMVLRVYFLSEYGEGNLISNLTWSNLTWKNLYQHCCFSFFALIIKWANITRNAILTTRGKQ